MTPRALDIRFPLTRLALLGGLVALLPLPWAQNCSGESLSGLSAAAAEPAAAAIVFGTLLITAALLFLARRVRDPLPRALVHALAVITASQALATLLVEMALAKSWHAAGSAAVAVVMLTVGDAALRGALSARPFARELLDDRLARWPLLGAGLSFLPFVAVGLMADEHGWVVLAMALPGAGALVLAALIHHARQRAAVPGDAAAILAGTAVAGGAFLLLAADPGALMMQAAAALVLLTGAPVVLQPVLRACGARSATLAP